MKFKIHSHRRKYTNILEPFFHPPSHLDDKHTSIYPSPVMSTFYARVAYGREPFGRISETCITHMGAVTAFYGLFSLITSATITTTATTEASTGCRKSQKNDPLKNEKSLFRN